MASRRRIDKGRDITSGVPGRGTSRVVELRSVQSFHLGSITADLGEIFSDRTASLCFNRLHDLLVGTRRASLVCLLFSDWLGEEVPLTKMPNFAAFELHQLCLFRLTYLIHQLDGANAFTTDSFLGAVPRVILVLRGDQ